MNDDPIEDISTEQLALGHLSHSDCIYLIRYIISRTVIAEAVIPCATTHMRSTCKKVTFTLKYRHLMTQY